MSLGEFLETDVFKGADYVEYFDVDGMEIEADEEELLEKDVFDYNQYSGGCLEVTLDM